MTANRPAISGAATVTPMVVYVHGIGNQPVADILKRQWDEALFGRDMGSRTRMVYWVNRRRYPCPVETGKILPVPAGLADWITAQVSLAVLPDVHDFLYRPYRRRVMERRFRDQLDRVQGPVVVIGHSLGSVIAYDVLRRLGTPETTVPLLVTLGSPLGLSEVQHVLRRWTRRRVLRVPGCVERWVNVADRLDAVAADPRLADDFSPSGFIQDVVRPGLNAHAPLGPHSATGYLRAPEVRRAVGALMALRTA
ncbi:MAG: hypothetical protein IMZ67_05375 [Acidobacteria bacterium]|nr:hypothetical protein [Acidobacteriota bacterium]